MSDIATTLSAMRSLPIDHEPDGWPAVRMRDITALVDEIDRLRTQAQTSAISAVTAYGQAEENWAEVLKLRGERQVLADLLRKASDPLDLMNNDGHGDQAEHDRLLTLLCDINAALGAIDAEALANSKHQSTSIAKANK